MTITWTAELETGLRQIDLQHQELVDLINQATAAHADGRDQEMRDTIMPKLSAYVIFHFGTEEALLSAAGVLMSHAAMHRQAHREFSARIQVLKQASLDGDPHALPELVNYLQQWLLDHIQVTDKELARQILTMPAGRR